MQFDVGIGEEQIRRARLAGHFDAVCTGLGNQINGIRRRDVHDVEPRTRRPCQGDGLGDRGFFDDGWAGFGMTDGTEVAGAFVVFGQATEDVLVFGVDGMRQAGFGGLFEDGEKRTGVGATQTDEFFFTTRGYCSAERFEADDAGVAEGCDVFAVIVGGTTVEGIVGIESVAHGVDAIGEGLGTVGRHRGDGHLAQHGDARYGRCTGRRCEVFAVGAAGVAHMGVRVDRPG